MEIKNFSREDIVNDRLLIKEWMWLTHSIYATWKEKDNVHYKNISELERDFKKESEKTKKEIIKLASEISGEKVKENDFFILWLEERMSKKTWLTEEEKQKFLYLLSVIPKKLPEAETDIGKNNFTNTFRSIEELDINPTLQKKVINFMYEAYQEGHTLTIWEAVRSYETQKEYFDKWWTKTMNSLHLTWEAIDFRENWSPHLSLKVKQIAAKYWLMNWAEMWDWFDEPHFQLKYTWDKDKVERRVETMKRRGTLDQSYEIPEELKPKDENNTNKKED